MSEFDDNDDVIIDDQAVEEESPSFVQLAIDQKPSEFADAVTTSLYDKVKDAIDGMRSDVASRLFNKTEEE